MFINNPKKSMTLSQTYTHKNNQGLGWGESYINPPKGPPCAWNPSFLIRRVKDQINPPSGPPSGSHIANDDDWAMAPPSHTQGQKSLKMNYGFEGVSNAKEYPRNCPRLGIDNPGWQ